MEIKLLGEMRLLQSGQIIDAGPALQRRVLAVLAVEAEAGKPVHTNTLIEQVWHDEETPRKPNDSLRVYISELRRIFAEHADGGPAVRIPRGRGGQYRLSLDVEQIDIFHMRRLRQRAAGVTGNDDRVRLLREANSLWQGDPLKDFSSTWAETVQEEWRQERKALVADWATAELAAGNPQPVIEPLRKLVNEDFGSERHVTLLMRALAAAGRRGEALDEFRSAHDQMSEEQGYQPGTEMNQVYQEILNDGVADVDTLTPRQRRHQGATSRGLDSNSSVQVGSIPPRADNFQDRPQAQKLFDAACAGQTAVLTQVVAGLGGVGKTQLAADFARRLWQDGHGELDLLVWVSALTRDSVVSSYVKAAGELGLGRDEEDPAVLLETFLNWLETTPQRWLIILDDLADPVAIEGLWPPQRPTGRVVITTRRRDATLLDRGGHVNIDVFSEAEAKDYIVRKLNRRPHLIDDVERIVTVLGAFPLALSHAAAYMIDMDISCDAYADQFVDRKNQLERLFPSKENRFDDYANTVSTTWEISVKKANDQYPAGLARPLMEIVSTLNPNGIPGRVLRARAAGAYLLGRIRDSPDRDDIHSPGANTIRQGLRGLHRFHLVTYENDVVRVHALVQRAVRDHLRGDGSPEKAAAPHQLMAVARASTDALLEVWPPADSDKDLSQLLRVNAVAIENNHPDAIWDPERGIHPIMTRTVQSLGTEVRLGEAVDLSARLDAMSGQRLGPDHPTTLALRNQTAAILGDRGQVREAVDSLDALIAEVTAALRKAREGADGKLVERLEIELVEVRRNYAYQSGQAGRPATAAHQLKTVLADQTRLLGAEHEAVIGTRTQLVYWRSKAGDTTGSVAELEDLVRLATRVHGVESRQTLELRSLLGTQRGDSVGPAQAAIEMQDLLEDMRRILGPDDRDVSVLRNNLAMQRWRAGDLIAAAAELRKLADERDHLHGPHHRDTIATRHGLSRVLVDLKRFSEAAVQLDKVIDGTSRMYGAKHPDTLGRRYALACVYEQMDRPHQVIAAEILHAVLDDQLAILDSDSHEAVIATKEALARVTALLETGDMRE
ncbi:BTAD domain-containing putative transcriptional regulator [Frankia sp. AgB32]|uniref:BTAD domain-containing putative transcriptional regulator n=1 Tax=Frankia sp. AgB32 TaxID=631119 RepID=UPI00200C8748|nr:BTAD domain-containing putative transcriptional regulator [Frankia sp. AgB32]MCK9895075.1 NB-ARC domain-containing protein [Frankia sp. AgB32]